MYQQLILDIQISKGYSLKHGLQCTLIGHVNVQSCLLIIFFNINQSAFSMLDWVLNNLSDFNKVLCMHHWEFPTQLKVIPTLTCPFDSRSQFEIWRTTHINFLPSLLSVLPQFLWPAYSHSSRGVRSTAPGTNTFLPDNVRDGSRTATISYVCILYNRPEEAR